jgi:hypothetical protein
MLQLTDGDELLELYIEAYTIGENCSDETACAAD